MRRMISEGGSAAPRAMLFRAASPRLFNIELATGRVRPSADKGLLDPPQAAFDHCRAKRRNKSAPRIMKTTFGTRWMSCRAKSRHLLLLSDCERHIHRNS